MSADHKPQRIRDPLHGLIEFESVEFYRALWTALQTQPFQRLRRIKQLGFSDLVFPGATHSRFAHSVGTFHVARTLVNLLNEQYGPSNKSNTKSERVIAAALLHDVGHGPFSHAFENVTRRLGFNNLKHEEFSDQLIRNGEISHVLTTEFGRGFADDVADIIRSSEPKGMYEAIVSSQFDADRLDYMQRDRLMTGTSHGAIDFIWLLANLKIGRVPITVDNRLVGNIDTLVLSPKALSAAETYVVSLFQLYTTVYFHKTTRGIEKLFSEMLFRVCDHVRGSRLKACGLPKGHPLARFAKSPASIDSILALDDSVVWGSLPMLADANDTVISEFAKRLRDRRLFKCIDIRQRIASLVGSKKGDDAAVHQKCSLLMSRIDEWKKENPDESHNLLTDETSRTPYKKIEASQGKLGQILVSMPGNELVDLSELSILVDASKPYRLWRVYFPPDNATVHDFVDRAIKDVANGNNQQTETQ